MKVLDVEQLIELANEIHDMSRRESPSYQGKLPWLGMMRTSKSLGTETVAMVDIIIASEPDRVFWDMFRKHYKKAKRPSMLPPMQQGNVASDFQREFSGEGARYLQRHLQSVGATYDPTYHYARVVPVVQSSGAGKSKTVVELAKLELGFFVCVRDPPGDQVVSEPPRDEEVIPWLMMTESDKEGTRRYKTLAIWLESLAIELVSFYRRQWQRLCEEDWPARQEQDSQRWQEFKISMAGLLSPAPSGSAAPDRTELLETVAERCRVRSETTVSIEWDPTAIGQLSRDLKRAWHNLEALLPKETTKDVQGSCGIFHLSIDECGKMSDKLSALRTVFYDILPERSFVLLLDTNTQISRLAGTVAKSASARAGIQQLVQPFTFLPQDVGMIEFAAQYQAVCRGRGEASESHEALLRWLPKMGRPLLDDTFLKGDPSVWTIGSINLSEALNKLICKPRDSPDTVKFDDHSMTALITQRFPLRLTGYNGEFSLVQVELK